MNPKLKQILVVMVKQAVNAALVTVTPFVTDHGDYNFNNWHGWEHMLTLVGGAILTREAMFWFPKLLAWSQTNIIATFMGD